jgi:hypothetical protein
VIRGLDEIGLGGLGSVDERKVLLKEGKIAVWDTWYVVIYSEAFRGTSYLVLLVLTICLSCLSKTNKTTRQLQLELELLARHWPRKEGLPSPRNGTNLPTR